MRVILGLDAIDAGTALIGGQPYASLQHSLSYEPLFRTDRGSPDGARDPVYQGGRSTARSTRRTLDQTMVPLHLR
jgi:hypothetical protein